MNVDNVPTVLTYVYDISIYGDGSYIESYLPFSPGKGSLRFSLSVKQWGIVRSKTGGQSSSVACGFVISLDTKILFGDKHRLNGSKRVNFFSVPYLSTSKSSTEYRQDDR